MLDAGEIESRLAKAMPQAGIAIEDPRGDGAYLVVTVVDARFAGLTLIEQHRLVYKAMGVETIDPPPAIALRTHSPA